jgi:hypothetical protein
MKCLDKYISEKYAGEREGSSFKDKVKYSKKDFDKWVELWRDDKLSKEVMISPYGKDTKFVLIYWVNHSQKQIQHIASYDIENETLMTDDIKLFEN